VTTGSPLHENDTQVPVRVDYQLSDKQSIFGRYLATRIETAVPYTLAPNDLLTTGGTGATQPVGSGADDLAQSFTIGDTYVLNANTVNSSRAYINRVGAHTPGATYFGPNAAGINVYSYLPSYTYIQASGAFTIGGGNFTANSFDTVTNFGVNDDVNVVHGSHQMAFGVNAMRAILNAVSNAFSMAQITMNGATTGAALADFLTGNISALRQQNPNPENLTQNFFSLYAQDTWKVTQRLTLTYGVRWNPFYPMSFKQGDLYNFSLANFYADKVSTVVPNAPPGFTYPGDPGFDGKSGMNTALGHFEPRIGIAFDPFGDGKTAIRMGAGIAYDYIREDLHENTSSVAPFRLTVNLAGVNLDNPWATFPGGNPFPYSYNPANPTFPTGIPYQSFLPIPPNLKTTSQDSWNLGIQRQFTPNVFASATYVGSHIDHLWDAIELNPAQYIPGNCVAGQYGLTAPGPCSTLANTNQRRLLSLSNPATSGNLGYLTQYDDGGTQGYNGLLLNSNWRIGQGLNLAGNYTWSHCIGLNLNGVQNFGAVYPHQANQDNGPVNRDLDVGPCTQDRRNIANITLVARTPKFSNKALSMTASGWTLSSIFSARSGQPLNVVTGTDVALNGFSFNGSTFQRPNQVLSNASSTTQGQSCSTSPCVNWFNAAAFAQPATGTYGNVGYDSVVGPGFWEWDEAVSRDFRVHEGQSLQVRAEAFNVTNSVRLGNPGVVVSQAATFGKILNSAASLNGNTGGGARVMQFALKYVF
jgi:hypothetical protein